MRIITLLLLFYLYSCDSSGNEKSISHINDTTGKITIKMTLPGIRYAYINYINDSFQVKSLKFANPTREDNIIYKTIWADKPIQFNYQNTFLSPNSKKSHNFQCNFILLPGDSISFILNNQGNILPEHLSDNNMLIDSLFGIDPKGLSIANRIRPDEVSSEEVKQYINKINSHFIEISNNIKGEYNSGQISYQRKQALDYFNILFKHYSIANNYYIFGDEESNKNLQQYYDSTFHYLRNHLYIFDKINTLLSTSLITFITAYEAHEKGIYTKNFLSYFDGVDDSLLKSKIYRTYLFSVFAHSILIKSSGQLNTLINKIKKRGITDSRFDSLLAQMKHQESLNNLKGVGIVNSEGDTLDYYSLISSLHGKYVFVHFWASWCGPCRKQMPYLRKSEIFFRDKDIIFIAISIDNDNQTREWIAASKSEGLYVKKYNYRLIKGNKNELLSIINLVSVPRYMLYNKSGIIVDNRFTTPDNRDFNTLLTNAISK